MSSCATYRLPDILLGLAIILLLSFIVILWTGFSIVIAEYSTVTENSSNFTAAAIKRQIFDRNHLEIRGHDGSEVLMQFGTTSENSRYSNEDQNTTWSHWKYDILPSGSGEFEHIVLAKANQNSYEDPLDEYSKAERHHSGHFRNSQSKVWDPHPQYEFIAFGRKFHLILREDSSFVPPGVTITHISKNSTLREYPDEELGCFYSGYLKSEPKSDVAVSLCHGMTGHLQTSTGNYLIKPTEHWSKDENIAVSLPLQHVIYRLSKKEFNDLLHDYIATDRTYECGLIDNESKENESRTAFDHKSSSGDWLTKECRRRRHVTFTYSSHDKSLSFEDVPVDDFNTSGKWRSRRALPKEYFIEIMVVADAKMIDYHGTALASYILVLMNMVSRIYKDPSIGNPISIAVVKIKNIDQTFGIKQHGSDGIGAADMLRKFCFWQKLNNPDEPSPEHHDAALLLTRENLCHNPSQKRCDTLGLAELGRMCSIGSSCAIVQDNGLATAFTIAHEIGHVLNMPHDDDPKCTRFRDRLGVHNIMSRMLDDNTEPWKWSKCSRHYVTDFLEAGLGNCLRDDPQTSNIMSRSSGSRLPGEDYSESQQCELVYGAGSIICPHMVSDGMLQREKMNKLRINKTWAYKERLCHSVCKRLWCTVPYWDDRTERCHTQHMPWADGTVCAQGKWCHHGECISKKNLEPVDGQWSEWKAYEECSRTCGGGIKRKFRECDNPAPKNGGNYCVGERVRYRSCSTKECPPGSIDFREEQCAAFDNDSRTIRNLTKNVKWHAKYTRIQPAERCKLFCQVAGNQYYMLREKVTDGTPCGPDTFHICVNGYCKPAGCDHVLNSTANLDTCGVCRGDNSTCQRISGSYNISEYGYTTVTKIPAGSSYIDIKQYGWNESYNDSNYLAVRLKDNGKYILNGNFTVMHRKVIIQTGVTLEYSGPEEVVERLNSSTPIHVDLILEVLSVGNVYPPQIMYEYTVPKKILDTFTWILSDWIACDRMCQGITYRRARCQSFESKEIMSEDYCPMKDKPREQSQTCNIHCELQWQEFPNSKTECSNHCGPGTLYIKYRCVQLLLSDPMNSSSSSLILPRSVPSHVCHHLQQPQERRPCLGPCDYAHWQYGRWSTCSVTCGYNGFQHRTAICVDIHNKTVPESNCPTDEKIIRQSCGHKSCPKWDYGEWSPCSVICGIGQRVRPYWCRVDNRVVHPNHCKSLSIENKQICDAGACAKWHTGDWTTCSSTCGDGFRRRMIMCKYANGTTSKDCNASSRPINSMSCLLEPCPTTSTQMTYSSKLPSDDLVQHENDINSHPIRFRPEYSWNVEGYEECSKSCGGGMAKQIVKCISIETGKIAPNHDYCNIKEKPENIVGCNGHQCPKWFAGVWSQCDVKCGEGYQHREVICQDLRGEIMNDSDCAGKKPTHAKKCQKPNCIPNKNSHNASTYMWRTASWGECSASCGSGVRYRKVTCHRINSFGWQDPNPVYGCSLSNKPPHEQSCKTRSCGDQFYWQPGSWKKCSQRCGRKGRQMRRLFCLDRFSRKVRRRNCPTNLRPQRRRKCNQKPCTGPNSCAEVQSRLNDNTDGEYTLHVGGKYMSIYCYGMKGLDPQEYLTLPTGDRENYAEIYDKRLRDPHLCPYDGRRNDSCDCNAESVTISGRTMFKRVRINVHTLHIIVDDYTFSMKMGKNNIEYGKAGDCYSQMDCPQGRFGINLSGTFLMLAPEVHWPKQKNAYSMINKINNQRVIGRCGGYCGFCTPSPGLKLNILLP